MRRWLFCRIGEPYSGCAEPVWQLLGTAIDRVRRVDAGSCSFFDRTPDGLELWCHTTAVPARRLTELLCSQDLLAGMPVRVETRQRPVSNPHRSGRDVRDELAAVSTELALSILPMAGPAEQLTNAAAQLRAVTDRIEPARRQPFLFLCWQAWTAELTPHQRDELTGAAEVGPPEETPESVAASWCRYAERTEQIVLGQQPGRELPLAYLMFRQVEATDNRLGIPAEIAAAAALGVRRADADRHQLVATGAQVSEG